MVTWWFLIRNDRGYPMKVTVQASDPYSALQQARAMYGEQNMISSNANFLSRQ